MKKNFLLILILSALAFNIHAQVPSWQWVTSPSGNNAEVITHCVATDASGNVYTTGYYYSGDVTFGAVNLGNSPDGDIYLVKYDSQGNVIWAQAIGNTGFDETRAITVDGNGNVYITGLYDGPQLMIGSTLLVNPDSTTTDMFIAKFDSSGMALWASGAGGTDREFAESIVTDFAGNVYVTGSFESASLTFGTTTLTNAYPGSEDIYLVKYNAQGNVLWAKSGSGTNLDWATSVTADPYGNVFIAGPFYSDTLSFDGNTILNSFSFMSYESMFVVKYDSAGNVSWVKEIAGNNFFNELYSLSADAFGNLLIAGTVTSDTVFIDATVITNINAGYYDMLLVRLDSSGNVLWANKSGGYGSDYAYAAVTDASGNSYVVGYFDSDTIYFDSTVFVTIDINTYSDMFLVKYDGNGSPIWAKSTAGIYQPFSYGYAQLGLAIGGQGNLFTCGSFVNDSIVFDAQTSFLNGNFTNIFLSKLQDTSSCSAAFSLFPDSATQHLYWALNQATGVAPISYHWEWGDGTFDNTAYPSHTYAVGGFYPICLTITDANSCTNTVCHTMQLLRMTQDANTNTMVQVNVVASLPVNSNDIEKETSITIYPNPASSSFRVSVSGTTMNFDVAIQNLIGDRIYSGSFHQQAIIDCMQFPIGLYFVSVKTEAGISVQKLIVE